MRHSQHINKPIQPVQHALRRTWILWLLYRLFAYPMLVGALSSATIVVGMAWQLLVLLPALLLTPTIKKGEAPYGLIVASLVMLIYLGAVGVFLFIRIYEGAPLMLCLGFALESILLLLINIQLFMLLKRLPPMHKQSSAHHTQSNS